jgi:hypothetical protein
MNTNMYYLSIYDLQNLEIPVVSKERQQQIVKKIESCGFHTYLNSGFTFNKKVFKYFYDFDL